MKTRLVTMMMLVTFLISLVGCATVSEENKGAATGAGIGAVTGVVAGSLLGGRGAKTEMAVIGGLLGALVGGAVGHYQYDAKRSRQETAQRYNYQSSMGSMVRIEETSAVPASVRPGDKVDLKATYALLDTASDASVSVTETREIRHNGELVGKPEVNVTRGGGTYTSTVPLFLPDNAAKGAYTVTTTVQAGGAKDTAQTTFHVK